MAPFIQRSHCSAHKGSLASKAVASVDLFKQVEAVLSDVYNFLSASPKMVRVVREVAAAWPTTSKARYCARLQEATGHCLPADQSPPMCPPAMRRRASSRRCNER